MSQGRIPPILRKKSHSRKSKARLARKATMLKKIAGKRNRVHRRKRYPRIRRVRRTLSRLPQRD